MYKTIEIRRIGGEDILFAWGRTYNGKGPGIITVNLVICM